MNFSKEYIKECDCEEIQGLSENLEYGNWYSNKREVRMVMTHGSLINTNKMVREASIWLPTGDQLEEEIVKICDDNGYSYGFIYRENRFHTYVAIGDDIKLGKKNLHEIEDDVGLAKIKLLKQLLQPNLGNNAEPIVDYPDDDPREVR